MARKYEAGYIFGDWIMTSRTTNTGFFLCSCGSLKPLSMSMCSIAKNQKGKKCDCSNRDHHGYILRNSNFGQSKYIGTKFGELTCTSRDSDGYLFLCSCGKEVRKQIRDAERFGHCGCRKLEKAVKEKSAQKKKPVEIEFFQTPTPAKTNPVSCRGCKFDVTYLQQLDGKICNCDTYEDDENGDCISKVVDRLNAEYWDIRNGRKKKEVEA